MKMTKNLLAAIGAAGLLAASGAAFAGDATNGSASTNDSKLEKKISAKLEREKQLKGDQVSANVDNGNVTLRGSVDRDEDKSRAERVVSGMKGVKNVDNQIQVSTDALLAPGSAGSDVGGGALPARPDVVPSGPRATGTGSEPGSTVVRERTNRVETQREVEVRPSQRGSGAMNSEREMREQTSGGAIVVPDPGVDSLPGAGSRDNGASPGNVSPPAGGPRPLPLPSDPASPSRRSTDNPGTERLPTTPSSSDYHNGTSLPGTTGASPGSPLR